MQLQMSGQPILEVKSINKEFNGIKALRNVSFSLNRGTITAVIGPNGAGKTTLINIISGFMRPGKGEIYFKDKKITGFPPYKISRMGIARTFQNTRLFLQISVLENVLLAMRYRNGENLNDVIFRRNRMLREEQEKIEKAIGFLKLVGLTEKRDESADNLSYGQRKLLELARAMATGAELFLLDEPLAGVFPETREKIMQLLKEMKSNGMTILFIEHNIKAVADISDRVIVLAHGDKIADGKTSDVFSDKEVIEAYLGGGD